MTELRQKMIRAMELKNLSKNTQRAYLAAVTGLARHYRQSPDEATQEMVDDYMLYLKNDKGLAPNSCGSALNGLRFFYKHVVEKDFSFCYSIPKKSRRLPTVLTMEEIWKIICAPDNMKHRMILMTTYAAGLRASEVAVLKPEHIDSKRMLIKIVDGKGHKDRYTMLSARLLNELRTYYKTYRPKNYLFPSQYKKKENRPLCYETIRSTYEDARKKAGVKQGVGVHTLRHHADSRIMPTPFDSFSHPTVVSVSFFFISLVYSA
jgi:integrase/recombinase XerD